MKKSLSFLAIIALAYLSTSCAKGKIDPMDMQTGLTVSDFDKALIKSPKDKKAEKEKKEKSEEPIPSASKLIVNPPPKTTINSKTISFSVTDQVQLKDVLIELGRVAKIDVDLDPDISGGIIINAKNRPLSEVIERIVDLGNLRYTYENGTLHFERDTPFVKNYSLDYLSEGSNLWSDVQANISAILTDSSAVSTGNTTVAATAATSANNPTAATPTVAATTSNSSTAIRKSSISINKSAGILYAFASQKQHGEIAKYLNEVQKNASAQVLIEAKLVEVTLKNIYKTGINWNWADMNSKGGANNIGSTNSYVASGPLDVTIGVLGATGLNAQVSALEQFGTTRTLSSPRVHAINNQKATLNFTDKFVYFKIDSSQATTTTGASTPTTTKTITSTKLEENIGVELTIVPSINIQTNEITLNIKPKITVKSDTVKDPASPTDSAGKVISELVNYVPVIQTREINTIAKIQSGNIIVIGGLMKENAANTDVGIPFLQRIPLLGYLFKSTSKESTVVETVIFIKATIMDSGSAANKVDREIQRKFDTNKREFF